MGVTKKPALWVSGDEMFPKVTNAPSQMIQLWEEYQVTFTELSFSEYWNKKMWYPQCRFYSSRDAWRFYFNTEADMTAWILGADLSPN